MERFSVKKIIEDKVCVSNFSTTLSETVFILRRIRRDIIINVHRFSHSVPLFLPGFNVKKNFLDTFSKNYNILNVIKIRPE